MAGITESELGLERGRNSQKHSLDAVMKQTKQLNRSAVGIMDADVNCS